PLRAAVRRADRVRLPARQPAPRVRPVRFRRRRRCGVDRPAGGRMSALLLLKHLADSEQASAFVLRGGMLTRLLVGPERRTTRDLDFLGLFPRDLDETRSRLQAWLPAES